MNPAFSVVDFTTLAGTAQGLLPAFIALALAYAAAHWFAPRATPAAARSRMWCPAKPHS
jgi:hypothetical protein